MKNSYPSPLLFLALFFLLPLAGLKAQTAAEALPGADFQPGWEASYEALAYEGEDLFFLINGGADLYMEYGFVDVAAVELNHPEKGSVYIELYRMDSDSAAFGIFSLRKGNLTMEINSGPWIVYGEDFLHVWHGPFYLSVSGGRLQKDARLQVFASLIGHLTEKAPAENNLPALFHEYRDAGFKSAAYIMGPLALNNIYNFGHENVFRTSEGLALEMETHRELVFSYSDNQTAGDTFNAVAQFMEGAGRFSQFNRDGESFSVKDRQNNQIDVSLKGSRTRVAIKKT
jgi:hypothetical protein